MINSFEAYKTDYHEMKERALIRQGNNYRFKQVIRKALEGEQVTIAYLGGSITEQKKNSSLEGYALLATNKFSESYASGSNVRLINAGMTGTSSLIGLLRLERDVLQHQPDIVFLEFAVNDARDDVHREAFEGLVRRLLLSKSEPVVILLFMQSEAGYSCQGQMQVVGDYYDLPMISICDALRPELAAGRMQWCDYSTDNIHPNQEGHRLISELIGYYFTTALAGAPAEDYQIPHNTIYGASFAELKMYDATNATPETTGSFEQALTLREFPSGWSYVSGTGNKSFRIRFSCKNLFILFKENKETSMGNAEVYVDGCYRETLSGFGLFGWGNPVMKFMIREDTIKEHVIEIRMASGDTGKEFSILAFGVSEAGMK